MEPTPEIVLKKYKVTGEIFPMNPDGPSEVALEVGSIQEVSELIGNEWVEKGLAEVEVSE